MNMATSKSIWAGLVMVVIGVLGLVLPEAVNWMSGAENPTQLIGTGVGIITLRLGIAKNGQNV